MARDRVELATATARRGAEVRLSDGFASAILISSRISFDSCTGGADLPRNQGVAALVCPWLVEAERQAGDLK